MPVQPLDKDFQCTRHWYWREYDEKRRLCLAGPEKYAAEEAEAEARAQVEEEARRAERIQQGLPPTDEFGAPAGARCCDVVLFGQPSWCGEASSVYTVAYQATHKSIQSTIESIAAVRGSGGRNTGNGDVEEEQPLLATEPGGSKS